MSRRAATENTIAKIAIGVVLAFGLGGAACVMYIERPDDNGDNDSPAQHANALVVTTLDAVPL